MSESEALLVSRGARPSYAEREAPPLDCRVHAGEILFLSADDEDLLCAVLKMLAGIESPLEGEVLILKQNPRDLDKAAGQSLRRQAGYVLRGGPLLSNLDGGSNLRFAANYHALGSEAEQQQRIDDLLGGLIGSGVYHRLPAYMSNIQRRLIAISRSLLLYPRILFLEFPFDGLSFRDREIVAGFIQKIAQRDQIAIVVCSDDMHCVQRLAQRIVRYEDDAVTVYPNWDQFHRANRSRIEQLRWTEKGLDNG